MGKFPYFTEEHEAVREIARGAAEEFKKTAEEADRKHDYNIIKKNLKRLAELNLIGIHIATEYGGEGLDFVGHCVALEEIAKGCLSTAFSFNTQRLAMDAIRLGGTEEQKKKYLIPACAVPSSPSRPLSPRRVRRCIDEDHGRQGRRQMGHQRTKHYITNAIIADAHVLVAKTTLPMRRSLSSRRSLSMPTTPA
jgi:alkylation response protein AidB-like acyl-CoA dehydrogenase